MTTFSYEARNSSGKLIKGKIQADNSNDAADVLLKDQLIPVNIIAEKEKSTVIPAEQSSSSFHFHWFAQTVKTEELVLFCRQMHALIKANVPISTAVQRVIEITANRALKKALTEVGKEIELGAALSKSMEHHPRIFSYLFVSLIASAEANGRLEDAFLHAANHFELMHSTRKRAKSALRYPIFVVTTAFIAMMVISLFVIPKFAGMYANFHAVLPLPTRMILSFSIFVQEFWWVIVSLVAVSIVLMRYFLQQDRFRLFFDRYILKMPIFGNILERIVMANFSRNLSMLLKTGVPLIHSLTLVSNVVDNQYAKEKVLAIRADIERGKSLVGAARASQFFSPLILQMLAVGEETGNIDQMLLEACQYYEQEVDDELKQLAARIEPLLLIVLGGIVLLIALGVFLPMWNMIYVVH